MTGCLLACILGSLQPSHADIIFQPLSQNGTVAGIGNVQPGSSTTYQFPTFDLEVTPSTVTFVMTQAAFADAQSTFLFDSVNWGFQPFAPLVGTAYSGTGTHVADLTYQFNVGGVFSGSGAQSSGSVDIQGKAGTIANPDFSTSYSNSANGGNFTEAYGFTPVTGMTEVGAGVDVTPSFSVADFKFQAGTSLSASMNNIWTNASITMTLTQVPETSAPEPGTSLLLGSALCALGIGMRRLRRRTWR